MFRRCATVAFVVCGVVVLCAGSAAAAVPGPGWEVTGRTAPSVLRPGGEGLVYVYVYDTGALESTGTATLTDTLPPGLVAKASAPVELSGGIGSQFCPGSGRVVTCIFGTVAPSSLPLLLAIPVSVEAGASGTPSPGDQATVTGGGASGATHTMIPVQFGSGEVGMGISDFDAWFTNADGTVDTQAGSHPYEATFTFGVNTAGLGFLAETPAGGELSAADVSLPPGLVGNPNAVPQCTRSQLESNECPPGSLIGEDYADISSGEGFFHFPVFNMVPPSGAPAQFAFDLYGTFTALDVHVRSGGDGGLTQHFDVPQAAIVYNTLTFWGVPSEHNGSGLPPVQLLTLPTSCGAPAKFSMEPLSSWQDPHATAPTAGFEYHTNEDVSTGFTGCESLTRFEPQVASLTPDTSFSDTATGVEARVKIPQGLSPEGLATSGLKEVTVTLPEGVSVNPGQASGLGACSLAEAGIGSNEPTDDGPAACPSSAKIGTVEIHTPILSDPLKGDIYLLQSSPPDLEILLAASGDGANVKIVGHVHLDGTTGRLTTTFDGTQQFPGLPDYPVSEFDLTFDGGPQAALVTPPTCGRYASNTTFTPWASPFIEPAFSEAAFAITSGPSGSGPAACTGPLPFAPSMAAGSTTELAGGFTNLSLLLQRGDGQQRVSNLSVKAPPGLLGMISSVPLCGEPQAAEGTCGSASQIGHTVVGAGPGGYPLYLPQPGQPQAPIYLTGPYDGAPFGLSVVVPIVAGPFDLGTEVVRARVEVDPHTAQAIITTNPFPTIVKGVPVDLRTISAVIDRPGFMFNPTSCEQQSFTGSVRSTEGAVTNIANRFQVGGCKALSFDPTFSVSTQAKTSKQKGASLIVKGRFPAGEANIHSVAVVLPKQLPARLTTIQQACPEAVFDANPASCPTGSNIGMATASTPVLARPFTGPVYLVSHGGAAFPDIEVVFQSDGVLFYLVGNIDIKKGVTSSDFATVPDAPISTFTLSLPEGPHSGLATNIPAKAKGNMCGQRLTMPFTSTGQDGAQVKQTVKIAVTGCPKAKKKSTTKKRTRVARAKQHGKGRKS